MAEGREPNGEPFRVRSRKRRKYSTHHTLLINNKFFHFAQVGPEFVFDQRLGLPFHHHLMMTVEHAEGLFFQFIYLRDIHFGYLFLYIIKGQPLFN